MFKLHNYFTDVKSVIIEAPTGLVQPRRGGHPMKLTYFLSPTELLDLTTQSMNTATVEFVHTKSIGQSVTINLQASVAHKLQIQPTMTAASDAQNISYEPLTTYNSTMLPASFVLTLNKPMAISQALLKAIVRVTDLPLDATEGGSPGKMEPVMGLIAASAVAEGGPRNLQKGLTVSLPDQCHCYFLTDNRDMAGQVVSTVPFTEPSQLFKVVGMLRQQALFNALIASCVRPNARPG